MKITRLVFLAGEEFYKYTKNIKVGYYTDIKIWFCIHDMFPLYRKVWIKGMMKGAGPRIIILAEVILRIPEAILPIPEAILHISEAILHRMASG